MSECCMTRKEANTQGMKRQAQELIEQAYNRGFKAGREDMQDWEKDQADRLIEQGMNMAWEAAGKVIKMGEYSRKFEVFPECGDGEYPFDKVSASEAIEKILEYEERQKEDNEIRVGDVIRDDDVEAVVTWCDGKNWNGFLIKRENENVGEVGQVFSCMSYDCWKKTGRAFPQIAEVLKKLQEGE